MGSKTTSDLRTITVTASVRNGTTTTTTAVERKIPMVSNITTSANIVGWKAKMAAGQDVSTTLLATRFTLKAAEGYRTSDFNGGNNAHSIVGRIMSQHLELPSTVGSSTVNRATSMAEVNFAKSYRKSSQTWSGGVFCGELLETARLFASPARAIRKGVDELHGRLKGLYRAHHKGKGGSARDLKRNVGETYLAWSFGIKPLAQDANDAALAFRKLSQGRTFDMVRVFGTAEAEDRVPGKSGTVMFNPGPSQVASADIKVGIEVFDTVDVTIRGAWRNSNPSGDMPVAPMFGMSMLDIVPTAWELVPWSFLVDYFINVGDVLDAWSMRFVQFAWLNRTTRSCRTQQWSDIMVKHSSPFYFRGVGGHAEAKRYDVSRVKITNEFNTGFHVQIPGFQKTGKWLNMAALLAMRGRPNFS